MSEPSSSSGDSGLGSLAQSARRTNLKSARWILVAIGILTLVANAIFYFGAESMVESEIQKELRSLGPGQQVDQAKLLEAKEQAVRVTRLIALGTAVIGAVFIVLGILVYQIPVLATVLGLVLYVGAFLVFAALDPTNMTRGIIIKILIVVGLFKAIQTAIAYRREQEAAAKAPEDFA